MSTAAPTLDERDLAAETPPDHQVEGGVVASRPAKEERPRTSARNIVTLVVAGFLVLVLLAIGVPKVMDAISSSDASDDATPTAPAPAPAGVTPAPSATPDAVSEVDRVLPDLIAFVEKTRELTFKTPVKPVLLDDEAFRRRITEEPAPRTPAREAEYQAQLRLVEGTLKTLGLIHADANFEEELQEFYGDAVLGAYDPQSGELLVRGTQVTPSSRATLVHELTHALDDQHFELYRPDLEDVRLEKADAFNSLVEGSAERVESAYVAAMSAEDRAAMDTESDTSPTPALMNDPIVVSMAFPYWAGEMFVDALLEHGGKKQLDAAFANPPVNTAQILVPERYLSHISGMLLTSPAGDGEAMISGLFGVDDLVAMLSPTASPEELFAVAAAWEGDKVIAWNDDAKTCVQVRLLFASAEASHAAAAIIAEWAARQPDARVEVHATVLLTACRPGVIAA